VIVLAAISIQALASVGTTTPVETEGVHNGSFEQGLSNDWSRPSHWYVGFPEDLEPQPGSWALVLREDAASRALELSSEAEDGVFVSQIVDLPARAMAGVTVTLKSAVRVTSDDGWAVAQLVALNAEAPPDPETGITHVGHLIIGSQNSEWTLIQDTVTLTDIAEILVIVLVASGDGTVARFDEISVTATIEPPGLGPDPTDAQLPATGLPRFPLGVTNESTRNPSDAANIELPLEASGIVDLVNLFVHVRWNAFAGLPLLDGHERIVEQARSLGWYGMPRMITFDFTHNSVEGIGNINPMPDGTPVGRLDDPMVRNAYLDELLALVEAVRPAIVSVGIETDFFWDKHPDQWSAFRDMLCEAEGLIEIADDSVHVTTYFTLSALLDEDGELDPDGTAAMRELRPCIDSVGYSTYPADGSRRLSDLPDGFFNAAAEVAPELPLIIPEFGYRSDGIYSEEEQEAFLRRVLEELSGFEVVAVVWYSLHDQSYLGVERWFQDAFRHIGLRHLDGTPKRSHALLQRIHDSGRHRHPAARLSPAGSQRARINALDSEPVSPQ
jgi:hypothetical protein